jgi:hypothetical protein
VVPKQPLDLAVHKAFAEGEVWTLYQFAFIQLVDGLVLGLRKALELLNSEHCYCAAFRAPAPDSASRTGGSTTRAANQLG